MSGTLSAALQTNAADASPQMDGFHLLRHTEITGQDFLSDLRLFGQNRHKSVCKEAPGVMFIITHSSMRRTIPVAFIIKLPVSVESYPFRKKKIEQKFPIFRKILLSDDGRSVFSPSPGIVRATRPKSGDLGRVVFAQVPITAIRKRNRLPFCLNSKKSGQKRRKRRLPVPAPRIAFQRRQNGDGSGSYQTQ